MKIWLKLDTVAHRPDPKCLAECPIDEQAAEAHLSLEFSREPGPHLIVRGWGPTYEIQAENAKARAEQIARMLKAHSELLFAVHRCAHWLAHMDIDTGSTVTSEDLYLTCARAIAAATGKKNALPPDRRDD